ncbi:MAG TPA: ATP-binding protein [Methanobacterium sp.]
MDNIALGTNTELTDEQFYNREEDISWMKNFLESTSKGSPPTIMVTGIRGVGKTVLLKKIKKELENDYLISYIDLSITSGYQKGKLTEVGIMNEFYDCWMNECKKKGITTIFKKILKMSKKSLGLREIVEVAGWPLPIPETEDDYKKLSKFVLDLPQSIYEEDPKRIKGSILIIDEFQAIKDLGVNLESFLWFFRGVIQSQRNVAYIFSGSVPSTDSVVKEMASNDGVFGGRILTFSIPPFTKDTVREYLKERIPSLIFEENGFERFYHCTKGVPFYVNTFARILPKEVSLDDDRVKIEFKNSLTFLAVHFMNQWSRLTFQEQCIITKVIDKPMKRIDIATSLGKKPGALSVSLRKLQDRGLLKSENRQYSITEPIFKAWLEKEYDEKGVFPFRSI